MDRMAERFESTLDWENSLSMARTNLNKVLAPFRLQIPKASLAKSWGAYRIQDLTLVEENLI